MAAEKAEAQKRLLMQPKRSEYSLSVSQIWLFTDINSNESFRVAYSCASAIIVIIIIIIIIIIIMIMIMIIIDAKQMLDFEKIGMFGEKPLEAV